MRKHAFAGQYAQKLAVKNWRKKVILDKITIIDTQKQKKISP